MSNTAAIILAAGEGKRMKSDKPKVLQEVLFKPMIDWVMDETGRAGVDKLCVVVGHGGEAVKKHLDEKNYKYTAVEQKEQLGTGHAVKTAMDWLLAEKPDDVLVLCGDTPLINQEIIKKSYKKHIHDKNAVTLMSSIADDPTGYGRILRKNGNVVAIVEDKDCDDDQKKINEINAGAYWFKTTALIDALNALGNNNAQGEYYLTDTVELIGKKGLRGDTYKIGMDCITGANSRKQLLSLNNIAREKILSKLLDDGVSIVNDAGIMVGPDVSVDHDTLLLPGTVLIGKTTVGSGCTIGPNSWIEDSVFGNNIVFNASQSRNSTVGDNATIGPFTQLRPNSNVSKDVHIGDFVEVKNSNIGVGTKVAHLTYVGDSDVGGGVNFGCGVVTVNYDGVNKNRTTIGDNAFIGCNTNLVAPVKVGNGAYTAAGSTITKDIPDGALSVARSRQTNIEGWAAKKLAGKKNKK